MLSKLFWGLFAPSHILLWTSVAAAILLVTVWQRAGRCLALSSAILFLLIGAVPTNVWLARSIESQYSRPRQPLSHVAGIVTLGGGRYRLRLTDTYELARRYPTARVIFSGGSGELLASDPGFEARDAGNFLIGLGLDPRRLTLEDRSRNTWENILFTQRLVKPQQGETWILATSALQLPRAMEIAHRLGWKMEPWPTDWVSGPQIGSRFFQIPDNLSGFDEAVRELIGGWAYRLSGKSTAVTE